MELVVLVLAFAAIASVAVHTWLTGVPPMPSGRRLRAVALDMLPDRIDGPIVELGAGWGGFAFDLARRRPDCRVIAVERSPLPWLVSRLRQAVAGRPNLTVVRADFHDLRIDEAGLAVAYLIPAAMDRLRDKLERDLAPGTPVLSLTFAIPGWRPVESRRADDLYRSPIYLYRRPGQPASGRVA